MTNKKIILTSLVAGFAIAAFAGFAPALGATSTDAASASAATSSNAAIADSLPSAGLTPLSPFYFLDRAADWARVNFFFFNPMKRAEVAAEVANERLAELKEVAEKNPQRDDVISELEDAVAKRIGEAHATLENLSAKNEKVAPLLKRVENLSLNGQRVMENMLLRSAPEKIKERTERALKNIYKLAEKRQEILMRQKEKGLISEAEAEKLINERMERMKKQIERRAERIAKIKNPVLRRKLKEIMSEKLNVLEDAVFSAESMKEGTTTGGAVGAGAVRKEAIKSILWARKRMMLRGATSTDEILREMYKGRIDFKKRAGELIEKAEERISEIKGDLGEMGSTTPKAVRSVKVLLASAGRHLAAAKKAFEAKEYRAAFGRAVSAVRTSRAAERILKELEGKGAFREKPERMGENERKEMEREMEKRMKRGRFERRPEGAEKFLKKFLKEREERTEKREDGGERVRMRRGGVEIAPGSRDTGGGEERPSVCAGQYDPVCGKNGITYPNECVAERQNGVDVLHKGKCRSGEKQEGLNGKERPPLPWRKMMNGNG